MRTISHWIGGKPVAGAGDRTGPVWNPATGEQAAEVPLADPHEVDAAVCAAASAFEQWADSSLSARTRVLFAFRELVNAHTEELARIVADEHGKVVSDALGEVRRGLEVVEFACGIPTLLKGDFSNQVSTGVDMFSFREPLGVCAGITPFNFPVMVPMWMHPVAIACGNTFVLKPENGFFVGPTVLDRVRPEMDVYREEIFGPVLSVLRADSVDEAIALVNSNPYGNGTALFTSSGEAARRFQRGVNVGMIGINVPIPVPMAYYSFGGRKDSLFGDTHVHGPEGVSFYTRAKVVTSRWPRASTGGGDASYYFPTSS